MAPTLSTQLRKDGGRAIIGRFDVMSKRALFRLFAVAEQEAGKYHLTVANLSIQNDVLNGQDEYTQEYVDQLDVNNDGVDEFITSDSHYEGHGYQIWKYYGPEQGWSVVHRGGC